MVFAYPKYSAMGREEERKKLRGISFQKEAIAIGTDETGKAVLKDIGFGHPSRIKLRKAWDGIIDKDSTVTHDRLHGYKGALDVSKEITVNSKIPEQEASSARSTISARASNGSSESITEYGRRTWTLTFASTRSSTTRVRP